VSPAGRRGVVQAAQLRGHLLRQGGSLGFTLTRDQLSLKGKVRGIKHTVLAGARSQCNMFDFVTVVRLRINFSMTSDLFLFFLTPPTGHI